MPVMVKLSQALLLFTLKLSQALLFIYIIVLINQKKIIIFAENFNKTWI